MMKKKLHILTLLLLLPLVATAAAEGDSGESAVYESSHGGIFSGIDGGITGHIGYGFAQDPKQMFGNATLESLEGIAQNLQKDGVMLGVGAFLKVNIIDHISVGAEANMSMMPLKTGSSVRNGWGGATLHFYTTWRRLRPFIGAGVGGGVLKRNYVFENGIYVKDDQGNEVCYNASHTQTPYFYIDPQLGFEVKLAQMIGLLIKFDYMLPFGNQQKSNISANDVLNEAKQIKWSNFLSPSGPRLYVGFLFGK